MTARVNMADADYEPTDEDLAQLASEAFADVKAANDRALARFWDEISAAMQSAAGTRPPREDSLA